MSNATIQEVFAMGASWQDSKITVSPGVYVVSESGTIWDSPVMDTSEAPVLLFGDSINSPFLREKAPVLAGRLESVGCGRRRFGLKQVRNVLFLFLPPLL